MSSPTKNKLYYHPQLWADGGVGAAGGCPAVPSWGAAALLLVERRLAEMVDLFFPRGIAIVEDQCLSWQ